VGFGRKGRDVQSPEGEDEIETPLLAAREVQVIYFSQWQDQDDGIAQDVGYSV